MFFEQILRTGGRLLKKNICDKNNLIQTSINQLNSDLC